MLGAFAVVMKPHEFSSYSPHTPLKKTKEYNSTGRDILMVLVQNEELSRRPGQEEMRECWSAHAFLVWNRIVGETVRLTDTKICT